MEVDLIPGFSASFGRCEDLQAYKLRRLFESAVHFEGYRELFEKRGIDYRKAPETGSLDRLPLASPESLRSLISKVKAGAHHAYHKCVIFKTSGTTRESQEIIFSCQEERWHNWLYARMLFRLGYRWSDKVLSLTHPQFAKNHRRNLLQRLGFFDMDALISLRVMPRSCELFVNRSAE
jgi:phenylacetate-coenzyme A ligase PaaK-like adenylate-forming protein